MAADFGDKEFNYGVGYPTPYSIPDDTSCWTIPVPNDAAWQAVLIGLLQTLTEEKSWQQYEGALSQEDAAGRWATMVTEFLFNSLVGCSATPPDGIRYNPDDDTVQTQTPDGAWHDNPDADPRHSGSNKFPPISSDDPQCDAAANMVAWIKSFIDTLVTVKDETGLVTAFFLDVLELLWGAGIFLAIITLFIETLLFLGIDTVLDAFTGGVYDTLLCIFFCNIEGDGQVTADDLAAINTAIDDQIGGTVATVLHAMFFIMGEIGLSNAGATGTETGDCSGCDCSGCYTWLFPVSDGGWIPYLDRGNWVDGEGWNAVAQGSGGYIEVVYTFPSPIHLTNFSVTYGENCAFNPIGSGTWISYVDGTGEHIIGGLSNDCGSPLNLNFDVGADDVTAIAFRMEQNSPTGFAGTTLIQATITGIWDDEPTGGEAC